METEGSLPQHNNPPNFPIPSQINTVPLPALTDYKYKARK